MRAFILSSALALSAFSYAAPAPAPLPCVLSVGDYTALRTPASGKALTKAAVHRLPVDDQQDLCKARRLAGLASTPEKNAGVVDANKLTRSDIPKNMSRYLTKAEFEGVRSLVLSILAVSAPAAGAPSAAPAEPVCERAGYSFRLTDEDLSVMKDGGMTREQFTALGADDKAYRHVCDARRIVRLVDAGTLTASDLCSLWYEQFLSPAESQRLTAETARLFHGLPDCPEASKSDADKDAGMNDMFEALGDDGK